MTTGVLHIYHPDRGLNVFEHLPSFQRTTPPTPKHVLLFIGGLFDNFNAPRYVNDLAALFPLHDQQTWRVMHAQLSSNGKSWGILDIDRDIEEIAICVRFIRDNVLNNENADVVLMGHSTGCQDTMRYLTAMNPLSENKPLRPKVQGAILQAPVSDRDAALHVIEEGAQIKKAYIHAMEIARSTPKQHERDVVLPLSSTKLIFGLAPISVARWLSLTSPDSPQNPSIEDFFSSDLGHETLNKTFGTVGRNGLLSQPKTATCARSILVLMSASDEYAKPNGGQAKLLLRWKTAMREETQAFIHKESIVVPNATHDVGGDDWPSKEARLIVMRRKVLTYLHDVVGDIDDVAWKVWQTDFDELMRLKGETEAQEAGDSVSGLKL